METNIFVIIGSGNGLTPESMLIYCELYSQEPTPMKCEPKYNDSIQGNAFEMPPAKFRSIVLGLNELN